ncbi:MAG: protein translocase subunit SecD [Candidatus Peregrinibacteria bacterium]
MTSQRSALWPVVTIVIAVAMLFVALPDTFKGWAPDFIRRPQVHFGLDLIGGTQLDFRISEQEMNDQISGLQTQIAALKDANASAVKISSLEMQLQSTQQQKTTIVEAIRSVLEKRVNSLGVSEAVITPSYFGNEKHLLVECPGVVDVQKCIATVGKTIQLEFKEEFTEATVAFEAQVRDRADAAMLRITASGETLQTVGQDLGTSLGASYAPSQRFFKSDLPKGAEDLWRLKPGKVARSEGTIVVPGQDAKGQPTQETIRVIILAEALGPRTSTGRVVNDAPTAFQIVAERNVGSTYSAQEKFDLANVDPVLAGTLRGMKPGNLQVVDQGAKGATLVFLRNYTPAVETMAASHILLSYKGASGAAETVTRTKEQALALAMDIKKQIDEGGNFAALAKQYSDDSSGKNGGSLSTFGRGAMVPAFEQAAFALAQGAISPPVESVFGYHIIRSDKAPSKKADTATFDELNFPGTGEIPTIPAQSSGGKLFLNAPISQAKILADKALADLQAGKVNRMEDAVEMRTLIFSLKPTGWKDTELNGKHFRSAGVTMDPTTNIPVVQISFDDQGAALFGALTKKNINKRIAIFVGGSLVTAPVVQTEIITGTAVITGSRTFEEAQQLAQELNTGAIPAPIYLVGQNTIEATLGSEALQTSLKAALVGILILMLFMLVVYKFLGFLANIALSIYAILFVVILKLPLFLFSGQYIILTLAGMAGIILSLGMAVDANVLIFERIKEELRKGKMLKTAVDIGFKRAWPSIRDGNASTLITCLILFMVGTSIVRGFAITLGMGVLLSMFTAIIVTRWLIRQTAHLSFAQNSRILVGIENTVPKEETFG